MLPFKLQLVLVSLRGKTSKLYGKMFSLNVMAVMSRVKKVVRETKTRKKRMKQVGSVEVPQEAFLAILKSEGK